MAVPSGAPASSTVPGTPPSRWRDAPLAAPRWRVRISTRLTAEMAARASPRKPRVPMRPRSSGERSLLVAWRRKAVGSSPGAMPQPLSVEIRRGGMGLIRVTDNGCGIAQSELPTAFLRHATSKLRAPEDLGRIGTLGFRGEALAAISAVSRVEILTRQRGAESGASLHLEGGVPAAVEEAGAPEGTAI